MDEELGLCYLRVPTWCPFRLQFYCNGHGWLARKLAAAGIDFTLADNAFVRIADSSGRRRWPMRSSPMNCTACWIATPQCCARWERCSVSAITGA